jgi:putative FmdB family regulatory protein
MPIYEYRCDQCGQTIEVLQKVGARQRRKCERCAGRLRKLVSRTSFHLKGGGWYTEGYSKKASTASSDAKPPESKPADKSEKKAASA